jgi:hypothetical protein
MGPGIRLDTGKVGAADAPAPVSSPAAPGSEAEEASQSDSSPTSETTEEPATA